MRSFVYRFYDEADRLLYVGLTDRPHSRLNGHRKVQPWFWMVHRIDVRPFKTRDDAAYAERHAIRTEDPLFNKVYAIRPVLTPEQMAERREIANERKASAQRRAFIAQHIPDFTIDADRLAFSVSQTAQILGCGSEKVRRLIANGELKAITNCSTRRFVPRIEIELYLVKRIGEQQKRRRRRPRSTAA